MEISVCSTKSGIYQPVGSLESNDLTK